MVRAAPAPKHTIAPNWELAQSTGLPSPGSEANGNRGIHIMTLLLLLEHIYTV
jgi:hypothetical protein